MNSNNIYSLVADAHPNSIDEGLTWYDRAHDHAVKLAHDIGIKTRQAAGILAAVSPQLDANINFSDAVHAMLFENRGAVTGKQRVKAIKCLTQDPTEVLNPCTGPKTWAFFWNIWAPSLRGQVTIDGRTVDIIDNTMRSWKTKRGIDTGGPGSFYEKMEFIVEDAAKHLSRTKKYAFITPPQVQAIAWCEAKRLEFAYPTKSNQPRKVGPIRIGQPYIKE